MMWLDFFLQRLVEAAAWFVCLTIWIAGLVVAAQVALWIASKWPFGGSDPESYS